MLFRSDFQSREAAEYRMAVSGVEMSEDHLRAIMGDDLGIPGATAYYACDYTYIADIDTGGVLDVVRDMNITVHPPTYEFLYDNMNSLTSLTGEFMGSTLQINNSVIGTDGGEGISQINVTTTTEFENGTGFMPPSYSEFPINVSSHEILFPNGSGTDLYWLFPPNPTQSDYYPMRMAFGPLKMMGIATKTAMGEGTATYTWSNTTAVPGEMLDPAYAGNLFNTTFTYVWDVDSFSGSVLSMSMMMDVDTGPGGWMNQTFGTTPESELNMGVSNKVVSWAISGVGQVILDASTTLHEDDTMMAVVKATATSNSLMIADGERPALELHLSMDEVTKQRMVATATETGLLLDQIPGLQQLHGMKAALGANDNQVAYVYYKQVPENIEGVSNGEGSVEFFADFAKETDDQIQLMGTTIPLILYAAALIMILLGIVLLMTGKKPQEQMPEE